MSCIASRRGLTSVLEVPNKKGSPLLISRAPHTMQKYLQTFDHFLGCWRSDEISSMIKQYSKGGTDAIIIVSKLISRWIFLISSVVKSFKIAKTVSFFLEARI
jgi:hypothetical protein